MIRLAVTRRPRRCLVMKAQQHVIQQQDLDVCYTTRFRRMLYNNKISAYVIQQDLNACYTTDLSACHANRPQHMLRVSTSHLGCLYVTILPHVVSNSLSTNSHKTHAVAFSAAADAPLCPSNCTGAWWLCRRGSFATPRRQCVPANYGLAREMLAGGMMMVPGDERFGLFGGAGGEVAQLGHFKLAQLGLAHHGPEQ